MAAWPTSTVGDFPRQVSVETEDNVIRTKLDGGPDKLRKRFANVVTLVRMGQLVLTKAQLDALEVFYITTTNGGIDVWTHDDPVSGATVNYRFVSRPSYGLVRAAAPVADRAWVTQLTVEILP